MSYFSRIVCVVDPTRKQQPALARAAWFARCTGVSLDLLVCCYKDNLRDERPFSAPFQQIARGALREARQRLLEINQEMLEELAAPLRTAGLKVETFSVWHHPLADGIVRHAVTRHADLVFKDTHHHSALSLTLFTNTDWRLLRTCPVPLWLVVPREFADNPTVLAAIDPVHEHDKPASLDNHILSISNEVAQASDGQVHAFHSFDPRVTLPPPAGHIYPNWSVPLENVERELREQHERRFDEVTAAHGIAGERKHLVPGLILEDLPKLAETLRADVVVMGSVARRCTKRFFIGATAEESLGTLACDLLVVKPEWFKAPAHPAEKPAQSESLA